MKHVFGAYNSYIDPRDDPFHPFTPDEWSQQTSTMLRTYLIQNLPDPHGPEPGSFWAHIFIQTYRILTSSNRADGLQKGY